MYRIQPTEPTHVPSYHLARQILAQEQLCEPGPLYRTFNLVVNNDASGNPQFVATAAHVVVGWCTITAQAHDPKGDFALLELGVIPHMRGKGIGSALLTAALHAAQQQGISRIALELNANDGQATHFYRRFGFVSEQMQQGRYTLSRDNTKQTMSHGGANMPWQVFNKETTS